ncbi:MolR family transcriptional regulator, partial [Klebsiella pneumoniae]|nr:MolR family transcriptional regulator [Klebsiella pneumoniae]
ISEERFFAHRLRQHDLNSADFCKTYEYELLCFMLEENHEFVQRTLQYVSKINYLIIARTLAEQGHELNRGKMREEF